MRPPAMAVAEPGDLALVKEANSTIHLGTNNDKLEHEGWTGPWKVGVVLQRSLGMNVEIEGRKTRTCRVFTITLTPFM